MEEAQVVDTLKEIVIACSDELGWANLAEIGPALKKEGVHYGKLSRFLSDFPHILETKMDTSVTPPAIYARLKDSHPPS